MIDLSYLTEEEQEMILSVLKRDAELKHKEEQRIKKLQKTEQDKRKLKYLTGEWFYETKSNRYRDKKHGSDIVRSSMTRRKPVTILELTQIWPGKSSFLKREIKDIYIPPELSGIIGEPSSSSPHDNREDLYQVAECKPSSYPQTKPRQNPFNSKPTEYPVKTDGHVPTDAPGNLHQVPADRKPAVESQSSLTKLTRTLQSPAEDNHEDLGEPRSSQVSEPSYILVQQGKVSQLITEGESLALKEEDESSINKVHGWVGMISRVSAKGNERRAVQVEKNKESPEGPGTPDTEMFASYIQTEIKITSPPELELNPRRDIRIETPENVLAKDDMDDMLFRPDDKQVNSNLCSEQCSAPGLNFTTEEPEANPCLSLISDGYDNIPDDIQQRECLCQGEESVNQLAGLMAFWESRYKGPKVLSIKKSVTNGNKVSERNISTIEVNSNNQNLNPSEVLNYTVEYESYKSCSESLNGVKYDDIISFAPSVGEKTSSCENFDKPEEHGLETESTFEYLNSPTKQMDNIPAYNLKEMYSPVLSAKNVISDLKACWERENISTPDYMPKHNCQQDLNISTILNRVESPVTSCFSLNIQPVESKGKLKQSSKTVLVNSSIGDMNRMFYNRLGTHVLGSDERINFSPESYPFKNYSLSQDQSEHFPIDISPTEKTPLKCLEYTPRWHNVYPQSCTKESSPGKDGKFLPEQHLLSFTGNTSEESVQYEITSPQSPSCFGWSQGSGTITIKQTCHVHSFPVSQSQTTVETMSPEPHRSLEGAEDAAPVVLKEQMQLDDRSSLTSSYIHLCCKHHMHLSSHVSEFSKQPDKSEGARVIVCETSEHISPSGNSLPESELTSDTTSRTSPKPWSLSRISSGCGNEDPSPIITAQKQASVRPISISKSLENLAVLPSNEKRKNEPKSEIQTMEEAPNTLSIAVLDPEQSKRLSVSVPAFMHEQGNGKESDCLSVNSFYSERQRNSSTNTNTSASSGLASMASVSGSVPNMSGTDFEHVEVKGTIQFAIDYVSKLGELHIFIVQCRDLAVAEPKRNRSNPYVKCYLLPDKAKLGKRKTSVKRKTLNPTYNEILRYKISMESLRVHTLNVSVWHNDTLGRNSFLGEVNMDLSEWDNNTHMMDCTLKGRLVTPSSPTHVNRNMEMCGDMRISLRFLLQTSQSNKMPQTGEIQVWVKECMNLPARRGAIDPYVKCSILPDNPEKKRQKSRVVKKTANPVFNHTMVYDGLRPEDLLDTCIELTVWDHDRLSNHFIAGTRLNIGTGKSHGFEVKWMDSNSTESALWRRMIESENEWVEGTVPLRMLIMTR